MESNDDKVGFLGKQFKYSKEIPSLDKYGVSSRGTFPQMFKNIKRLGDYNDMILEGPAMGVDYFLQTGICTGGNDNGKLMYRYVRNIPTGDTILGKNNKGLLPGILEDISKLNPGDLLAPLFSSQEDNKSLSDYDRESESNCKKIRRLNKTCHYNECETKCEEKMISKKYDECKDLKAEPRRWSKKYSAFCSESDRNNLKRQCEGFTNYRNTIEHYKNLKDTNTLTIVIITIMVLLFTYLVINRN
mgnify:FL=1